MAGVLYATAGRSRLEELVEHQEHRWGQVDQDPRIEIRKACWDLAMENPLGYGVGNAQPLIAPRVMNGHYPLVDAHNEFLIVLVECGWVGFLLYATGHLMLAWRGWRCFRLGTRWPLALLVVVGASFLTSSAYDKFTWMSLGLIGGATTALARTPVRKPAPVVR
jgi:O-antigen ligase